MVSSSSSASSAPESLAAMAALTSRRCRRCATALSMRLASALASCSRATASSLARQHFLYLLPLPQGQGSLRPGLAIVVSIFAPRRTPPCTETCWLTPSSMSCCSPMIATLPTPHGARVARGAAALFIPLRMAQAAWQALPPWGRARPALQLLLRSRWLSITGDAAVAALPRPQGLHRRDRGANCDPAARRDGAAHAGTYRADRRRPPHCRALAHVVA